MRTFRTIALGSLALLVAAGASACDTDATGLAAASSQANFSQADGEGTEASAAAHRNLTTLRDELLAADRAFATLGAATNLIESLVAPLAADGIFLAPGTGFLRGPDEVRDFLNTNPANIDSKWRWSVIRADVSSDGQNGYTYGYSELELPTGVVLPGKYQAYWARQSNGDWKMASFKRSQRAPGAVSLVPPPGFETPTTRHRRYYPNTEPAAELQTVFGVDIAFSDAAQSGVADAFAAYVAPDGAQSRGLIAWAFGPDEIRAAWAGVAPTFTWAPELGDVATSGDLGFTVGYVYSGGVAFSKYFTVWQKQPNGVWRYIVD